MRHTPLLIPVTRVWNLVGKHHTFVDKSCRLNQKLYDKGVIVELRTILKLLELETEYDDKYLA